MILYKYFPPERKGFFEKPFLRFTQPSAFNDPFEFLPVHDFQEKGMREWAQERHEWGYFEGVPIEDLLREVDALAAAFQNAFMTDFDFVGVLCLSEVWDNILMWSHYAANHGGFVVGFDGDHPTFKNDFTLCGPVKYRDQRVRRKPKGKVWPQQMIFTKSKLWRYEKEWRFCREFSERDVTVGEKREVHLFEIPKPAVRSLMLGARMPPEVREEMLRATGQWPALEVYQMHLHHTEFKLIRAMYQAE